MSIADIPTEKLWGELSSEEDGTQPPAWHAAVLDARNAEWEMREEVSEDWEEVKKALGFKS